MKGHLVITIGRQCGAGGRSVAKLIAGKLGVQCYDKELLSRAAKDSGLCEELFETHDEKPTSSFLYSLVMDTYSTGYTSAGYMDMPLNHKVFLAQFDTIKNLANEGPCVIVGRCADYALADYPNTTSVFLVASEKDRIERLNKLYNTTDSVRTKDNMIKTDKKRASYYNYYSSKKWGDSKSYDLCINTSAIGVEHAADIILAFAQAKVEYNKAKGL